MRKTEIEWKVVSISKMKSQQYRTHRWGDQPYTIPNQESLLEFALLSLVRGSMVVRTFKQKIIRHHQFQHLTHVLKNRISTARSHWI